MQDVHSMILPKRISDWPAKFQELYEERAAIIEFMANGSRDAAEILAECDVRKIAKEREK